VVAFLCATPYFVLDWEQTVKDFAYQKGFVQNGVGNVAAGWGWSWLTLKVMPDSFGLAVALLLAAGMIWAAVRPRLGVVSLLGFLLVAFVGMTGSRYAFYRYVLIPLPALALLAGCLVGDAAELLARWLPPARARRAIGAALLLLLVPSMIRDWKLNRILERRDSRSLAREWILQNIPAGPIAASEPGTPYGKPQLPLSYSWVPIEDAAALRAKGVLYVLADSSPLAFYSPGPSPAQLAQLEQHATLAFDVDPVEPGAAPPVFDLADAFYAPLQHASSMSRPGPRIRIWRLNP
jgi:hypothetical protein